jgi:hypothetical protein
LRKGTTCLPGTILKLLCPLRTHFSAIVNDQISPKEFKIYTSYIENEFDNQIPAAFNFKRRCSGGSKGHLPKVVAEVNGHVEVVYLRRYQRIKGDKLAWQKKF